MEISKKIHDLYESNIEEFVNYLDKEIDSIFAKNNIDTKKTLMDLFLTHRLMYVYKFIEENSDVINKFKFLFNRIFQDDINCYDIIVDEISSQNRNMTLEKYINSIYCNNEINSRMTAIIQNAVNNLYSIMPLFELKFLFKELVFEIFKSIFSNGDDNILSLFYRPLTLNIDNCVKFKPNFIKSQDFREFLNSDRFRLYEYYTYHENCEEFLKSRCTCEPFRKWIFELYNINYKEELLKCVVEI